MSAAVATPTIASRMRALAIAILLSVVLVAGGLMLFGGSSSSVAIAPSTAAAPTPQAAVPSAPHADLDATPLREAPSDAQRVATATPPPAKVDGIEDAGAAPIEADYARKYKDLSRSMLELQLKRVERRLELDSSRAYAERFEANKYSTYSIDPRDARDVDEIARSYLQQGQLCSTRLLASNGVGADGKQLRPAAVQVVCLPREEFQLLYQLADERDWLRAAIERTPATTK